MDTLQFIDSNDPVVLNIFKTASIYFKIYYKANLESLNHFKVALKANVYI